MLLVLVLVMTACSAGDSSHSDKKSLLAEASGCGDRITTMKKARSDKKLHKVTYKLTKIIRDPQKTKEIIDRYNNSGKATTIGDKDKDDEYVVCRYEVKYPQNYPVNEYGITDPKLNFKIVNRNGGDTITIGNTEYLGLGKTWEIGEQPMGYDFYPGQTYKGAFVFIMIKGYDGYLIEEYYKDGNKTVKHYIKP
ncbi:MAG: hypothetical protein ACOX4I_01755 [Anaerovoracaceae bacterium]